MINDTRDEKRTYFKKDGRILAKARVPTVCSQMQSFNEPFSSYFFTSFHLRVDRGQLKKVRFALLRIAKVLRYLGKIFS